MDKNILTPIILTPGCGIDAYKMSPPLAFISGQENLGAKVFAE